MNLIGYWRDPDHETESTYPDPKDFVNPGWLRAERALLVAYLRPKQHLMGQWGYSWCRFHCGISDRDMGSLCFTDGIWAWPQGLAHYVEKHSIVLPDEFIETCRQNAWSCPDRSPAWNLRDKSTDFWLAWTQRYLDAKDRA